MPFSEIEIDADEVKVEVKSGRASAPGYGLAHDDEVVLLDEKSFRYVTILIQAGQGNALAKAIELAKHGELTDALARAGVLKAAAE